MIPRLDFCRLVRLLQRTDSTFDDESLHSMRLANRMMRRAGMSWGELLLRVIDQEIKAKPPPDPEPEKALEEIVRFLYSKEKITEEEARMLMNSIRLVFRSRDTGFRRKVQRQIVKTFQRATMVVDSL